jgi:large subunit ribosomal protein L30
MGKLKITQTRSSIKKGQNQKANLEALGLKKIGHSVEHKESPIVDGMINKVKHLVKVEAVK